MMMHTEPAWSHMPLNADVKPRGMINTSAVHPPRSSARADESQSTGKSSDRVASSSTGQPNTLGWRQFAKNTEQVLACIQAMAKYYRLLPPEGSVGSLSAAGHLAEQVMEAAQQFSYREFERVTAVLLNPYGLDLGSLSLALAHRRYAREPKFMQRINEVRSTYRLPPLPDAQGLAAAKAAMRPWLSCLQQGGALTATTAVTRPEHVMA